MGIFITGTQDDRRSCCRDDLYQCLRRVCIDNLDLKLPGMLSQTAETAIGVA